MMKFDSWFQCFGTCPGRYPLTEVIYRCPNCGGLLEVSHHLEALKQLPPSEWIRRFENRYMTTQWPYGSGVWGKKELVYPNVSNENIVSIMEGGTNMFWADRFGKEIGLDDLWIKQSGNSHTGSFKDLGMTVLVSAVKQIISKGSPIEAIVCASTGDTSASLSAYCAAAGIPAVVLLPVKKVSPAQLIQPISNGALTLALDTDFDGCMDIVQKLSREKHLYLANSINPLRIEGQKTLSVEIVQQDDWQVPDWVVVPGGNLGNITAIGLGFLMMLELGIIQTLPRLVCAQSAKAAPLYNSYLNGFKKFTAVKAGTTLASAIQIGNPVSAPKAIPILTRFSGIVEQATENELSHAAAMADKSGLFTCPQTGVGLAVLLKLVSRGEIQSSDKVVVISTAHGLKFTEFKTGYHGNRLEGIKSGLSNQPLELPGDFNSVARAITANIP